MGINDGLTSLGLGDADDCTSKQGELPRQQPAVLSSPWCEGRAAPEKLAGADAPVTVSAVCV